MITIKGILPIQLEDFANGLPDICEEMYLVGGAIRNTLSGKEVKDLDFVVKKNSILAARRVADAFGGGFYILDKKRQTARAIILIKERSWKIDFSLYNGDSIESDLKARDFTVNAIAAKIPNDGQLLDILDGKRDLNDKYLRPCSKTSFVDDPVRTIRAIRFLNEYGLSISTKNAEDIQNSANALSQVSNERKRDEFISIIENCEISVALSISKSYKILYEVFPDLRLLEGLSLSSPHVHDAWIHTRQVVDYCQQLTAFLQNDSKIRASHPLLVRAIHVISKYKKQLEDYFNQPVNKDRSIFSLLILAALFHDVGKGAVTPVIKNGRKSFSKHAKKGAEINRKWAINFGFSKIEVDYLSKMIQYHMKPSKDEFNDANNKDIYVHRFFQKTGPTGILLGFIHLADVLATYEETITEKRWKKAVSSVDNIFNAYFLNYDKIVKPPKIINGYDIRKEFGLAPGKQIGNLLNEVMERQVSGEISSKKEAFLLIKNLISEKTSAVK